MTWIAVGIAVAGAGATVYGKHRKGMAAKNAASDLKKSITASKDIANAETKTAWKEYGLQRNQTLEQATGAVLASADSTRKNLMTINKQKESLIKAGGFAGSGEIDAQAELSSEDLRASHEGSIAGVESQVGSEVEKMSLQQSKNLAQIEERLQSKLAEIETIPDSYSEGFWS